MEWVVGILTLLLIVQQFHIHMLLNKLMSRNYYDYEITKKSLQSMDEGQGIKTEAQTTQQNFNEGLERDLNYLGM